MKDTVINWGLGIALIAVLVWLTLYGNVLIDAAYDLSTPITEAIR